MRDEGTGYQEVRDTRGNRRLQQLRYDTIRYETTRNQRSREKKTETGAGGYIQDTGMYESERDTEPSSSSRAIH